MHVYIYTYTYIHICVCVFVLLQVANLGTTLRCLEHDSSGCWVLFSAAAPWSGLYHQFPNESNASLGYHGFLDS